MYYIIGYEINKLGSESKKHLRGSYNMPCVHHIDRSPTGPGSFKLIFGSIVALILPTLRF